jgi:hypothetical protein
MHSRLAKFVRTAKAYSAKRTRKTKVPDTTVSILTVTSKMPGPSFSLPAGKACPNRKGDICKHCYATKGCYRYTPVREAQEIRFAWTRKAMQTSAGQDQWVTTMSEAIRTSRAPYFRGHDSGDFFSVEYLRAWIGVCENLTDVRFWFPTREYQSKASTELLPVLNPRLALLRKLASLPNVTVRPSALNIGDAVPQVPGLAAGSTVGNANVHGCPATEQNGECRDCRHCWDAKTEPVSYNLH